MAQRRASASAYIDNVHEFVVVVWCRDVGVWVVLHVVVPMQLMSWGPTLVMLSFASSYRSRNVVLGLVAVLVPQVGLMKVVEF